MDGHWLITFRSITFGQKGERVLKSGGIACSLRKTPKMISARGCGYCLQLRANDGPEGLRLLQNAQVGYTGIYLLHGNGDVEEINL